MMNTSKSRWRRRLSGTRRPLKWLAMGSSLFAATIGVLGYQRMATYVADGGNLLITVNCNGLSITRHTPSIATSSDDAAAAAEFAGFVQSEFGAGLNIVHRQDFPRITLAPLKFQSIGCRHIAWIPLWFLLVMGSTPLCISLFFSNRADRFSEHCTCGYSLFGNCSAICPECGTPIPADQMKRIRQASTSLQSVVSEKVSF